MLEPLYEKTGYPKANKKHFIKSTHEHIERSDFAGFLTDNALCMGIVEVDPINFGVRTGRELCWMSRGKDGFDVLREWVTWCENMGATHIYMSTNIKEHSERRSKVRDYMMKKIGFEPIQTTWMRTLV